MYGGWRIVYSLSVSAWWPDDETAVMTKDGGTVSLHRLRGEHRREEPVAAQVCCNSCMDRKAHWQRVYTTRPADAVSWFQATPTVSEQLLEAAGLSPST